MAPVVEALSNVTGLRLAVCGTGQHTELLEQALAQFGLAPTHLVRLDRADPSLDALTAALLTQLPSVVREVRPGWVVVHGDTTSSLAGALCGYHAKAHVAHVEAGLRTDTLWSPWPEELNRRVVDTIAELHFAPTLGARANLLREGRPPERVLVTGNTVVDALVQMLRRPGHRAALAALLPLEYTGEDDHRRIVVVTCHRRESHGEGVASLCRAVRRLAVAYPAARFVFPVHPNPLVLGPAQEILGGLPNALLTEPIPYGPFAHLLLRATAVLTDSGGLQEEAVTLGVPVVIARSRTERPEVLSQRGVSLVGTDTRRIIEAMETVLAGPVRPGRLRLDGPFGDGRAADRIARALVSGPDTVEPWCE